MKIVYLTNILNHYQYALSNGFDKLSEVDYKFIATTSLSKERKALGIPDYNHVAPYSICAMDSDEEAKRAYDEFVEADVGMVGSVRKKYQHFYQQRLRENKLTFWASERVYKQEPPKYEMPLRWALYIFRHSIHKSKYMLCASAFTSYDYSRTGNYKNKAFKWGYFPEFIDYDIDELMGWKSTDKKTRIVWTGRYLGWKHPESMIVLGEYLKNRGYDFEINMLGTGELFDSIRETVKEKDLEDVVHVLGAMPPEWVRKLMEKANIFAFTSDRGEGWGVVLNEAMNSGCAVLGSHAIGSVPYLIDDGKNGLIFKSEDWDDLCEKTEKLILSPERQKEYGRAAFSTIKETWNPDVAAERLKVLAECIMQGKQTPYTSGPCSVAELIQDDWYN